MANLIICCDGTWNNPHQEDNGVPAPTNVVKLSNAIALHDGDGVAQKKYYHPGLGGEETGLKDKLLGGALGVGITRHICSAYHWLGNNYAAGDAIYIFGFSRGAFTARCIAGMLGKGLLDLGDVDSRESWKRVESAYKSGYRKKVTNRRKPDWPVFHNGDPVQVRFLGVWDTVGALGIPDDLELLNLFDNPKKWRFHDTDLGDNVECGRHAMALDEKRSSFTVTHWKNADAHANARELWFPGAHSDVGGGYAETDLSDGALSWMLDEAVDAGLAIRPGAREQLRPVPTGVLHNSYKGLFAKMRSRPRAIPEVANPANAGQFHASTLERQAISPLSYPAYHPRQNLPVGGSVTVPVFADTRWNPLYLFLDSGQEYRFSASGEWKDSKDTCDWHGTDDDKLTTGDIVRGVSSFLGSLEKTYRKLTDNESTDFWGTKRVESMPWFVMVGAIANDNGDKKAVKNDGSPNPHQYINLTEYEDTPFTVEHPGYLYAFPNDVWSLYENNHGSIDLTITRVS
jgi:hypothetical protein